MVYRYLVLRGDAYLWSICLLMVFSSAAGFISEWGDLWFSLSNIAYNMSVFPCKETMERRWTMMILPRRIEERPGIVEIVCNGGQNLSGCPPLLFSILIHLFISLFFFLSVIVLLSRIVVFFLFLYLRDGAHKYLESVVPLLVRRSWWVWRD